MRSPALFAFIGACSLLSVSLSAGAVVLEGRVTSVADGDTIRVQTADGNIRIRFLGIDAPESDQEFGAEAKTALTQLILHKRVLVKTDSNDQYGRALAQVAYQNHDVGLYMLEHGYAWVYQRYIGSIDEDWQDAYMAAERAAKEDGLGLWQSIGPVPPWTSVRSFEGVTVADYDDEESFFQKGRNVVLELMQNSAIGRVVLEALKMGLLAALCYVLMCTVGEILLFLIKLLKLALEDGML